MEQCNPVPSSDNTTDDLYNAPNNTETELNEQNPDVNSTDVALRQVEEVFKYLSELGNDPFMNSYQGVAEGLNFYLVKK